MAQNTDEQTTIPFYPTHIKSEIRVVWILIGIVVVIGMIALFRRWFMSHSEYMIIAIFILVFIGLLLSSECGMEDLSLA